MNVRVCFLFAYVAVISALYPKLNHGSYEMLFSHEKVSERDRNVETRIPLIPASNTLFPEVEATKEIQPKGAEPKFPVAASTDNSVDSMIETEDSSTPEETTENTNEPSIIENVVTEESSTEKEQEATTPVSTSTETSEATTASSTSKAPTASSTSKAATASSTSEATTAAVETSAIACYNVYGNCKRYKMVCNSPNYDALLTQMCAEYCGKCAGFAQLPYHVRCRDSYKRCSSLGDRFCKAPGYTDLQKMDKCAKTCGYC